MLVAFVVVAVTACSGAATDSAVPTAGATASTEEPGANAPSGDAPPESGVVAPEQTDRERPEGRDAPDFSLALGQGGEFNLSSEAKPVYMVFWAEW